MIATPAYLFDADRFRGRVRLVKEALGADIPLTYAIKANPFFLHALPDELAHLEVCSPGELDICRSLSVPPSRILYSGVVKRRADLEDAFRYGVDLVTAESPAQAALIRELHPADRETRVLLRLSSGNQFGMDDDTLLAAAKEVLAEPGLCLYGVHYYSGTQKKQKQIEADLKHLQALLERLFAETGVRPSLVEYGPGLPSSCFLADEAACEEAERAALSEALPLLRGFAQEWPLGIELGRFLAAPAGIYMTRVEDIKTSDGVTYALVDGGMHHLRYHGQMLGMQAPVITASDAEGNPLSGPEAEVCVCGSLCTVADVLVRKISLPGLRVADRLTFARCGAYSVTEAGVLFLSRPAPAVWLSSEGRTVCLREERSTAAWNGA